MSDEPPVDRSNRLHHILVGGHALTRAPDWVLGLILLGLALTVAGIWVALTRLPRFSWLAAGVYAAFVTADWLWLAALPRFAISYGPVQPALVGLIGARYLLSLLPLLGYGLGLSTAACALLLVCLQLLLLVVAAYATLIEPFRLGVTHLEVVARKWPAGCRMRLVQVSDLHIERITRRERELVERVNALEPDYVLLTGDYLNFSYVGEPQAIADARWVLGALRARGGIYAVRGTHTIDPNAVMPLLFDELAVQWLRNRHTVVGADGCRIAFVGASCTRRRDIDVPALQLALRDVPGEAFTVLLYHTPELVPEAAAGGVDLYLAGHTHGGQIRFPLYGALVTATDVGKRYEMGRYEVDDLTLYVSRGIGMEGMAAPRARFLCPPEIVCIDVVGIARCPDG